VGVGSIEAWVRLGLIAEERYFSKIQPRSGGDAGAAEPPLAALILTKI